MSLDPNKVVSIVRAAMTASKPASVAAWRILDDALADSHWPGPWPLVEFEFPEGERTREEYGAPGANIWNDRSAFLIHAHVDRRTSLAPARIAIRDVEALFLGKTIDGVVFIKSYPEFVDPDGEGLSRGVSRGVRYRAEWRGP
jgi:hypothetical protein